MKTFRKTLIFLALIVSVMTLYSFVTYAKEVTLVASDNNPWMSNKHTKVKMIVKNIPKNCKGKQWKFTSSDTSAATVKAVGKTSCIVTRKKNYKNDIIVLRAKCKNVTCYEAITVNSDANIVLARRSPKTASWEKIVYKSRKASAGNYINEYGEELPEGSHRNADGTMTSVNKNYDPDYHKNNQVYVPRAEKEASIKSGTRDSKGILWQALWWGYDSNGKVVYDYTDSLIEYYKKNIDKLNMSYIQIGDTVITKNG